MANVKNITDLPLAESAEGLNLIVNDGGAAKQIAASAVGAQADWAETDENSPAFVKNKPGVAQPDWNENDETKASFIKNRPFYDNSVYEITPLTTIKGTSVKYGGYLKLCGVLDYDINQLKTFTLYYNTTTIENATFTKSADGTMFYNKENGAPLFVYYPTQEIADGAGVTPGLYAITWTPEGTEIEATYSLKFVINENPIKQIDPIYIPKEGNNTTVSDEYAHAEGNSTNASGSYSHAEGNSTNASGQASHAEGDSTTASGWASHAEGSNTNASGDYTHVEGVGTTASNYYAHAEGNGATASGYASHAEGSNTNASGSGSHAEGDSTNASGQASHAEGDSTTASGWASHAEGRQTTASGTYSHAGGYQTTATSKSQHVQGEYNILDTTGSSTKRGKYAHIIGNGTSSNARSNAHTIDWSGNAWYAGTVECTGIILTSPNGTKYQVSITNDGTLSATAVQ